MKKIISTLIILSGMISALFCQTDIDQAFDIQAIVQTAPPSVTLKWELTSYNINISVSRKLREDAAFGTPVALAANATEYTDNTVAAGKIYEYYVNGSSASIITGSAREYISVAINSPLIDYRGKVLLLVESSLNIPLADDINRLMMDMRGDGWQVIKIDVDKAAKPPAVRTLIQTAYNLDKTNIKAVLLLGQIAQPLSGCIAPDGHGEHYGAWATDMYYADVDGTWTDVTANCTSGWFDNIPGDGKFDQNALPSPAELQVGRVDMSNLPSFPESQNDLVKRYLLKDHNFRLKIISPPRKGVVLDHFHWGFAWSGFYYFNAVFGKSNTVYGSTLDFMTGNYLWGYACAAGEKDGFVFEDWHSSDFAAKTYNQVFTMIFGSFFGDYQMGDNFMKAALASKGWILTCSWAGRPMWVYHHMATGDNIGYSTLINMNNNNEGTYFGSCYGAAVQTDLLGDPTLRQDMITPPMNVNSSVISSHVKITWSPSMDSVQGYHIYKGKGLDSVFTRVTASVVTDTFWTDPAVADAQYYYQVKAFRMEKGRCGSYGNTSRGIFTSNDPAVIEYPFEINKPYIVANIPDQTGYIKKTFKYIVPLAITFADKDPGDVLTYEIFEAGKTKLPAYWSYITSTKTITVSPLPTKPIHIFVVVRASDMTMNSVTDTFEINIIDTTQTILLTDIFSDESPGIYPNPATSSVRISFNSECVCAAEITVVNITGKQVLSSVITVVEGINETDLSVGSLADGIYFITVKTPVQNYKGRVIIAK